MKGSEKGLQELFNKYTDYVPYATHSFNLFEEKMSFHVTEVVGYVGILEELYIFFSKSPLRIFIHTVIKIFFK